MESAAATAEGPGTATTDSPAASTSVLSTPCNSIWVGNRALAVRPKRVHRVDNGISIASANAGNAKFKR